jgi:two-component system, chemotaxis family, CheB/CheR fusion protein
MPEIDREFEALLNYLKHDRGCDLTGYKRSTLMRRFQFRMQKLDLDSYRDYLRYLQNHGKESIELLNTVFINVTSFFRDRDTWNYLASEIVPKIIARKQPDLSIRVWSAGCSLGQEVYTLAILFAEALGIETCLEQVRFYATDIDEAAIIQARLATYSADDVTEIPSELLDKYFDRTSRGYIFHQQLRNNIIFGQHNLAEDAPISKIDLLICRNVLIYFNSATQTSILSRFHFALKKTGFLFLGNSETLTTHKQIFTPIDLKHRVFAKGLNLELDEYLLISPSKHKKDPAIEVMTQQIQIWKTAYENSPIAQIAVNYNGFLIFANERASILLKLTLNDWNRPFQELEFGKLINLDALLETFDRDRRPVTLKNIEWFSSEGTKYLDVFIVPVFDRHERSIGINFSIF